MISEFCQCPKGLNSGPCKHKAAIAKYRNIAAFSVLPDSDPHMRALYHYIAYGETLEEHWYRGQHDPPNMVINVKEFIAQKVNDNPYKESSGDRTNMDDQSYYENLDDLQENDGSGSYVDCPEEVNENIIEDKDIQNFTKAWKNYGEKIINEMKENQNNKNLSKAVKSSIKIMNKSLSSKLPTITRQLILFGKDHLVAKKRGRTAGGINVQPTTLARSKNTGTRLSGKKSMTRGRQPKDKSKAQLNITEEDESGNRRKEK